MEEYFEVYLTKFNSYDTAKRIIQVSNKYVYLLRIYGHHLSEMLQLK